MFQLTQNAALTIDDARRQRNVPMNYGVRLSGRKAPSGEIDLQIHFAEAPAPSDTVAERHGTHVFIAEELAGPLSAATLDVGRAVSKDGVTPANALVLRPQEPTDHA